jgi:hypothetical protein
MPLTLLVPDLFPPAVFPVAWPVTPGLDALLSKGRLERGKAMTFEEWLLDAWQVQGQPVAALRRLAYGLQPDDHVWLCADPVHLRVERDHLQLIDDHHFSLTAEEARLLADAVSAHFADDGLTIDVLDPTHWNIKIRAESAPDSAPIWRVADESLFEHLLEPAGGIDWKALGNEVQMLLFNHPVNDARSARGDLPVNGLWFWGAGPLPLQRALLPDVVYAKDELARGLALHAECRLLNVPEKFALWSPSQDAEMIVLDGLSHAVRAHDAEAWAKELKRLEEAWFAPIAQAVWDRQLAEIRAVFPGEKNTAYLHASRADFWKIWRKKNPAATHA